MKLIKLKIYQFFFKNELVNNENYKDIIIIH
jgi:hypothetical protein